MKPDSILIGVIFVLVIGLISCKSQSEISIEGSYSPDINILDEFKWYIKGKAFIVSTSLDLRKDSTFAYNSCGCETYGEWNTKQDTLFLNHLRIELIDTTKASCYKQNFYTIKNNKLISNTESKYIEVIEK